MRSDNLDMGGSVPSWVYRVDAPPEVADDPPAQQLTAETSRDAVLVCVAGMVIVAILAYLVGRAAG